MCVCACVCSKRLKNFGRSARTERTTTSSTSSASSSGLFTLACSSPFFLRLFLLPFDETGSTTSRTRGISSRAITPFQSFLLFLIGGGENGRNRERQREREREKERERKREIERKKERERERERARRKEARSNEQLFSCSLVTWSLFRGSLLETHVSSFLWNRNK